jgi:hypothetical protein
MLLIPRIARRQPSELGVVGADAVAGDGSVWRQAANRS